MTTEQLHAAMPFTATLAIESLHASASEVRLAMAWDEARCTAAGMLHGGALMALADAAGGLCAALNLPEDATGTATLSSATNLVRAVREGTVTARSRPIHGGRTTIVVETELHDDDARLVAKTTQTQAVLR